MTGFYSVATGGVINAADVNQYKSMLEGASGYTTTYLLTSTTGTNFIIKLGDAAGTNKLSIQDSAGVEQAYINSDGLVAGNNISFTSLQLPVSAAAAPTTDGQVVWDSDDDVLTVGTGSTTKVIGLLRGAGIVGTATRELAFNTTTNQFSVWDGSAARYFEGNQAIITKAANETVNASTTLQNDDDFLFTAAANIDYLVEAKLLLTGAAASDWKCAWTLTGMTFDVNFFTPLNGSPVLTQAVAQASATAQAVIFTTAAASHIEEMTFIIHSGSTGGTCNFQWAQNTSDASDTKVLKNSTMTIKKLGAT